MSTIPEQLRLAVCLFPGVTVLDYQGPMELLGALSKKVLENLMMASVFSEMPKYSINVEYLAATMEPVEPMSGPSVVPERTYDELIASKEQYDILLVPGGEAILARDLRPSINVVYARTPGPGARPEAVPASLVDFIRKQAPGAQYILSVCTGSWILSGTGVLNGKKATTNKFSFKSVQVSGPSFSVSTLKSSMSWQESTRDLPITWVPKARWVVDGNIWTSSGVTAGRICHFDLI
jgi:putative intracellular protease/amidase